MQYRRLGNTGLQVICCYTTIGSTCQLIWCKHRPSYHCGLLTPHVNVQVSVLGYGVMTFGRQTDVPAVSLMLTRKEMQYSAHQELLSSDYVFASTLLFRGGHPALLLALGI